MDDHVDTDALTARDYLLQSRDVIDAALNEAGFIDTLVAIANQMSSALQSGKKLLFCGNGGSAADCQHIAGEFVSRLKYDRAPLPALALTADTSVLTAVGNDYGYDRVFERQVLGLGTGGDILVALSTSGRSPNILKAIAAGRQKGLRVIGFTGATGGEMPPLCDICLRVPSDLTPLIQQVHLTSAHVICGLVESRLFPRSG